MILLGDSAKIEFHLGDLCMRGNNPHNYPHIEPTHCLIRFDISAQSLLAYPLIHPERVFFVSEKMPEIDVVLDCQVHARRAHAPKNITVFIIPELHRIVL